MCSWLHLTDSTEHTLKCLYVGGVVWNWEGETVKEKTEGNQLHLDKTERLQKHLRVALELCVLQEKAFWIINRSAKACMYYLQSQRWGHWYASWGILLCVNISNPFTRESHVWFHRFINLARFSIVGLSTDTNLFVVSGVLWQEMCLLSFYLITPVICLLNWKAWGVVVRLSWKLK